MFLAEFAIALTNWPAAIAKMEENAVRGVAERIADRMRSRVRSRSGKLRRSIRVEKGGSKNELLGAEVAFGFTVRAGGPLTTKPIKSTRRGRRGSVGPGGLVFERAPGSVGSQTAEGDLATSYDYAIAEEYGTRRERARPFFRPTIREMAPEFERVVNDAFEDAVRQVNLDFRRR